MSTALTLQEQRLAIAPPKYSSEQVKLLADTIARGCDENEMKLFLEISKLSRLNPFIGQIRPVKRWNSDLGREAMVIQVGIDGYRSMASRTSELAGIEDAIFDSEDSDHPKWSKVTVYRWSHDEKIPYTATARWSEYVQKKKDGNPNSMWLRMPYLMLAKCAEALALRKAFPDELAGVYTEEEMGQADNPEPAQQGKPPVREPQRASEKKKAEPEAQKEDQKKADETEKITGQIESLKAGKEGTVWVNVDKNLVVFESKFVDDTLKVGAMVAVKTQKRHSARVGDFYAVLSVLEAPAAPAGEVVDGEIVEEATEAPADAPAAGVQDLFDAGQVQTASSLPAGSGKKPGTIGIKEAQRLYMVMNNNKDKTGLTETILKSKVLPNLPLPIEHLRDLETGMVDEFRKFLTGELDWREAFEE